MDLRDQQNPPKSDKVLLPSSQAQHLDPPANLPNPLQIKKPQVNSTPHHSKPPRAKEKRKKNHKKNGARNRANEPSSATLQDRPERITSTSTSKTPTAKSTTKKEIAQTRSTTSDQKEKKIIKTSKIQTKGKEMSGEERTKRLTGVIWEYKMRVPPKSVPTLTHVAPATRDHAASRHWMPPATISNGCDYASSDIYPFFT